MTSRLTCGSRSPVTVTLFRAGSSRLWLVPGPPPGAGIERGMLLSSVWSPTIQKVAPGRTPSSSPSSDAFWRSGLSPRTRDAAICSTPGWLPITSVLSSRKAAAAEPRPVRSSLKR